MILNGFLKKSFFKIGMWHSRPPRDPQENISMFSRCSELTPRAPIPDGRMAQIMQPSESRLSIGQYKSTFWLIHHVLEFRTDPANQLTWWSGLPRSLELDRGFAVPQVPSGVRPLILDNNQFGFNGHKHHFRHCGRGENIELYNSEVKSWRVGIARSCSRLWPPEARPDNFFTRPTCNGSKRPSAMLSIENDQVLFRQMWIDFWGHRCKIGRV